jgi:uncharacterized membrane protein
MPTSPFRDRQQASLFLLLLLASVALGLLLAGRLYLNRDQVSFQFSIGYWLSTRGGTFLFLLWNLVLAWVPYLAALAFDRAERRRASRLTLAAWIVLWLVFFPNAPYLITDLVHLRHRPPVPWWYDITLMYSAASTGLMLGLLSLYEVHHALRRRLSRQLAWLFSIGAIGLGSFGIWLGRFQRWNSWDLLANPFALLRDVVHTLSHPAGFVRAAGMTILLSGILLLGFGFLQAMLTRRMMNDE